MADGTIVRQKKDKDGGGGAAQSLIRKLTTEKAVKAHRQETQQTSITEDDITNVKLTSRGIKTIESLELPSLRRLDLSKNSLNRLKGLQGCPQVTYLTAAGNELTGDGLDGVRPLKDLKVFNASGNRVRRIPPAVFAQFRQLQALVLSDNEISEVPPTWLKKGLLSLNTLVLSHNKLKSLSGTGLGRLTALTKLSISYNTLVELPDLSACSGLEELRAAHNVVTQVPASLSKNAALRTLDLGHNRIDDWVGLERLGKSLKSLMQLSLSGNPICGAAAAAEKSGTGEEDGEEDYVAKVRSLFPGLKVRDGKRILMKKSHTYYEQRGGEQGAGAGTGRGRKDSAMRGATPGSGGKRAPGIAAKARPVKGDEVDGGGGDKSGDREGGQLISGEAKEESSRPKEMRVGQQGQGSGASSANMDEEGAGTSKEERKRKRKAARKAAAEEAQTEAAAAITSKQDRNTKKRRRREEEEGRGRSGSSPVEEAAAAAASESADKLTKKQRRRRREGGTTAVETIAAAGAATTVVNKKKKKTATSGGEGGRAQQQEDPYSSSEELPIPGRGGGGDSLAGEAPTAKRAADAAVPVRESGVVSVVINTKRKGAKAKARQDSSAAGRPGRGGLGGFSVGAMLEARGQKETIGLGSGVSAWD